MSTKVERGSPAGDGRHVVRLRGLPWSCTDEEILSFLNVSVVSDGIKKTLTREGRPSGEAYVEVESLDEMGKALDKDHALMGKRYIEVFTSSFKEMNYVLERQNGVNESGDGNHDHIVRLRGLPFSCTEDEIVQFFRGLEIVQNGIVVLADSKGKCTGEAYVEFRTGGDVAEALGKHKEKIGHRYIEIFNSTRKSMAEAQHPTSVGSSIGPNRMTFAYGGRRPVPYDRPVDRRSQRGNMDLNRFGGVARRSRYEAEYEQDYYSRDQFYDADPYSAPLQEGFGYENDYEDAHDHRLNRLGMAAGGLHSGGMQAGAHRAGGGGYQQQQLGGYYNDNETDFYYDQGGYSDNGGFNRGGVSSRAGGAEFVVHMRGLPFKSTDDDIASFFSPIVPVNVRREYGEDGRISGEANIEFASYQDAKAAMKKDRQLIQTRYIELFYQGDDIRRGGGGGGGRPRPLMDEMAQSMRGSKPMGGGRLGPMRRRQPTSNGGRNSGGGGGYRY